MMEKNREEIKWNENEERQLLVFLPLSKSTYFVGYIIQPFVFLVCLIDSILQTQQEKNKQTRRKDKEALLHRCRIQRKITAVQTPHT